MRSANHMPLTWSSQTVTCTPLTIQCTLTALKVAAEVIMCIQTSSKEASTMTKYEYWETLLPRHCICRLANADGDLIAIQARDDLVGDFLDCNL